MSTEQLDELKCIIEAAIMAAPEPLTIRRIKALFADDAQPETEHIHAAIKFLTDDCDGRGIELVKIGRGYRYQSREKYALWLRRLASTRPPRYSRAQLETLAIIAYRQPVSRGDIEQIRGVSVSTDIMRALMDREWIVQVGFRDVPGRPALYGTTEVFLSYFGLKSLGELPVLIQQRDQQTIAAELNITLPLAQIDSTANDRLEIMADSTEPSIQAGVDSQSPSGTAKNGDSEALVTLDDDHLEQPLNQNEIAAPNSNVHSREQVQSEKTESEKTQSQIKDKQPATFTTG